MPSLNKRNVGLTVMQHAVRQRSLELYTKAMVKKWITEEVTVLGDSRTYQLGLLVVQQIVHANPSVVDIIPTVVQRII
jgi:hypothetical protein